ncbi:phage tail tape measure protein [Escherichia coli]|nr:phage tail tape measure protein [Escherichia coli]EJN3867670.1 phage tail tape measure protein [Escherichia coli]EJN4456685.1 phage tail tape measure protein [Escherichia coli]EJN4475581.1 phage tail tape measure protein [Escherichia coli]EKQ6903585.1 phage tail tape measure protein [Escherichia coli]
MMNNLHIRVALAAADRLTRPVTRARETVSALSDSLRETQDSIRSLERQSQAFASAQEKFEETTRKIAGVQEQLSRLQQAERNGMALSERQREMMASLTARLERLNRVRGVHQQRLEESRRELERHGIAAEGSSQSIQAAIRRTAEYNEELERQRRALTQVTRAQQRYEQAQERLGRIRNTGAAALAAGSAGLYATGRSVAPVMDLQRHGAVIAAQAGEGASAATGYTGVINHMVHTGITPDAQLAAEAVGAVRSTLGGLGVVGENELTRITRKMLDMQAVMGGDIPQHIQAAAVMIKNGLARSSDEAVDLMVAGMQRMGPVMRDELPEILHEYSTHFRNMGLTGSETMTLLADMAQQGKFALDKTGDAIKEFSIRGSDMSKASTEAYALIGLDAARMSSAVASGGAAARAAMQKTAAGLLKIADPAERANAAIALFGTPVEDLSVDQIPAFLGALARVSDRMADVSGVADRMGQTLRDNLSGDVARLTGTFSALRSGIIGEITDDLRGLVRMATAWGERLQAWVNAHPELVRMIALTTGTVLALTTAVGALSVAAWMVVAPLLKLRLGLALLRAIPAGLSVAGTLYGGLTGVISAVGAALGALTWPVAAAVGALVGGALLIWRYWDRVRAFVSGFIEGVQSALAPFMATASRFAPLLDLVSGALSRIQAWFKSLLTPVSSTRDLLEQCTSAGQTFGSTLASALAVVFSPLEALIDGLAWVLEKLGVLPAEAERVKRKLDEVGKTPVAWEWDPEQKKMIQKVWHWSPPGGTSTPSGVSGTQPPPVTSPAGISTDGNRDVLRHLKGIEGNTGGLLNDARRRIGPGDIVFKDLPRALAVRGQWHEPVTVAASGAVFPLPDGEIRVLAQPPARPASVARQAVMPVDRFQGDVHVHLHGVNTNNPRELARMVGDAVRAEMNRMVRAGTGSFRDRD